MDTRYWKEYEAADDSGKLEILLLLLDEATEIEKPAILKLISKLMFGRDNGVF